MPSRLFSYPLLACLAVLGLARPGDAMPIEGVYAQTGGTLNLQTVAPLGVVQIDYAPSLARANGAGPMQVLQAAARFPAPLLDGGLTLRGLLGYQQRWAYYDGLEDTYGGIDVGLAAELHLGSLPFVGEYARPISLYAFGAGNRLVTAKANGQPFGTDGLILPTYGAGIGVQVPTGGSLYLGVETFSLPAELGTGLTTFSHSLRYFNQVALGYRW